MWRLRCVTFSSTSRLIPLFNLFSSRTVCVSRHPPLLTSISPPPIRSSLLYYPHYFDERANASPPLCHLLFLFPSFSFLALFLSPNTSRPLFLRLCSLFVQCFVDSFSFSFFFSPYWYTLFFLSSTLLDSLSFFILSPTTLYSPATVLGGSLLSTADPWLACVHYRVVYKDGELNFLKRLCAAGIYVRTSVYILLVEYNVNDIHLWNV